MNIRSISRKNFILGLIGIGALLRPSNLFSGTEAGKLGILGSLLDYSGMPKSLLPKAVILENYQDAIASLKSGKIFALVSTPHYLLNSHPELICFGQMPNYVETEKRADWIQANYSRIGEIYDEQGLDSQFIGLTSPLRIRVLKASIETIESWRNPKEKIIMAANGARKLWFNHLGFETQSGEYIDRCTYQLELVGRKLMDLSDSHSPGLILKSVLHNNSIGTLPLEKLKEKYVIKDRATSGSIPVEIVFRAGTQGAQERALLDMYKTAVQELLSAEAKYQVAALGLLNNTLSLKLVEGLPSDLEVKLKNIQLKHINLIRNEFPQSKELLTSYLRLIS